MRSGISGGGSSCRACEVSWRARVGSDPSPLVEISPKDAGSPAPASLRDSAFYLLNEH